MSTPAPAAPEPPRPAKRTTLLGLAALLLASLGLLLSLPYTERGSTWLLRGAQALLPGLTIQTPQGTLLRDFAAERLVWRLNASQRLVIDQARWTGLRFTHSPTWGLHLDTLSASRVAIEGPAPANAPATTLPTRLALPLGVEIDAVRIDRFETDALKTQPVRELQLALHLAAGPNARHEARALSLHWDHLLAQGSFSIGAAAPLLLKAQLKLQSEAPVNTPAGAVNPPPASSLPASPLPTSPLPADWHAQLQAHGALARFKVQGRLRAKGQSLDAEALLRPAHALPIETAEARMEGLDLADLSSRWPHTALSGLVEAHFGDEAQPSVQLKASVRNLAAGRTDQGELPVRELQLQASSAVNTPGLGELQQFMLDLGNTRSSAGRLQGQGQWRTEGSGAGRAVAVQLQTRLQALRPALLDDNAPAIELSGPASLVWRQPWPTPQAQGTEPADTPLGTGRLQADWTGRSLTAAASGSYPAVRLQVDAQGSPERVQLHRFEASAGTAQWLASGLAQRQPSAWSVQLQSSLRAFDPALWLGAHAGLPASRIDAQAKADLRWTDAPTPRPWPSRLQGQAELLLQPSLLAGVPATGQLHLRTNANNSTGLNTGLNTEGLLHLGALQAGLAPVELNLQGLLDTRASVNTTNTTALAQDRWQLRWTARQLDALNPWLRLLQGRPELSGQSQGQLSLNGRWPQVVSNGELQAPLLRWRQDSSPATSPVVPTTTAQTAVQSVAREVARDTARATDQVVAAAQQALGALPSPASPTRAGSQALPGTAATPGRSLTELQDLQLQWQLGSRAADPFLLDTRLAQARGAGWRLLASTLKGQGRMDAHTLRLQSTALPLSAPASAQSPPTATAAPTTLSAAPLDGTLPWSLQLAAEGAWVMGSPPATADLPSWGWQGQLSTLQASRARSARQPALVLRSEPSAFSWLVNADSTQAQFGPTRLRVGEATLAIDTLHWSRNSQGPSLDLQARLEPSLLAPLLAQAQPGFGWRGDLLLVGTAQVHARPGRFQAQLGLARQSGDLAVEDSELGTGAQTLGLSELDLQLQAQDGHWTLQERIGGARMGSLRGDFSATTAAAAWAPSAATPVRGQLDLNITQLGFWGAWLPTGWRLGGQLAMNAQVSGTLGQPRLQGELQGQRIAVRNVLQGVDWHSAELHAQLSGDTLLLDRFTLQAGPGSLSATGKAVLGSSPTLSLQATAARFAALQRIDRRVVVSGQAELLIDASRLKLTSQLRADEGRIDFSRSDAPGLANDVVVQRAGEDTAPVNTQRKTSQRSLQLDVRADLGPQFFLVGRGLNTRLAGELRLTSPNNKPALQGSIRAEDGTYAAYGQKLGIERGLISFTGPIENPRLDVRATRTDLDDVKVGVAITGTAQAPRVRLYSDPEMSDTDKLSWLLMGRASDGLGRTDLALLQRAAYALISGESEGPSLIQRFGIDSLSVSQSEGTVQETVVSLGKQLSRRWYLGYERSLQATTGTWLLTYKLAQRFTVRAQSGAENALDFIWSWKWGLNE